MTIPKPQLRSSSLPLFMTCSNAVLNPDQLQAMEVRLDEMSGVGTLIHESARALVETGSYDLTPLKQRMPAEDYDRAGKLMRNFTAIWREASKHMSNPQTEVYLEADTTFVTVTGHIDLVSMGKEKAFILDYKAGRQHEDHFHQVAAYAYLVWNDAGMPRQYSVNATVVYLEDMSVHPYHFDAPTIEAWAKELDAQVQQPRYTVGRKCAGCSLQHACPAYKTFMRSTAEAFNDETAIPQKSWEQMTPEQRGEIIDRIYVIEKAVDRAKLGLRNLVKQEGRVDIGDGKEMVLIEERNKFLDTRRALPVLQKHLPKAELDKIARMPLDEVLSAFAKRAAKGQKIKARDELLEKLDDARALVRYSSTRMWRRPKGEKVLNAP